MARQNHQERHSLSLKNRKPKPAKKSLRAKQTLMPISKEKRSEGK